MAVESSIFGAQCHGHAKDSHSGNKSSFCPLEDRVTPISEVQVERGKILRPGPGRLFAPIGPGLLGAPGAQALPESGGRAGRHRRTPGQGKGRAAALRRRPG